MRPVYYHVAPRYTAGSPAQVSLDVALRVVDEEHRGYSAALRGIYGPDDQRKAQVEGLGKIVEEREEHAKWWIVTDLMLGQRFVRLFEQHRNERTRRAAYAKTGYRVEP